MTMPPGIPVLPAPAKLNLFLHITGRRGDGYHELQTVFQFLDVADTLGFELLTDGRIEPGYQLAGVDRTQDLIIKAAKQLQSHSKCSLGVRIHLHKRLPMGAGLGGGSSDAATVLCALDRLWGLDLGLEELAQLGLELGADVPVFVRGQAAWAEGIGERLTPLTGLPEPWYLVLVPPVSVSTAEIFSHSALNRACPAITIRDFLQGAGSNVCEPVVRQVYPEVDDVMVWLAQYAPARMTGTGAAVFARFDSSNHADQVLAQVPSRWQAFVARGRNRSPLVSALEQWPRAG
jgi:4-diphosphocytidyl-2-C-methyl-D-erythritol kinase